MRCAIPKAYILDITTYKMHVLSCSYYKIRINISKTLTGTYEGVYSYVFMYTRMYVCMYVCMYNKNITSHARDRHL